VCGHAAGRFVTRGSTREAVTDRHSTQHDWRPGRQTVGEGELALGGVRVPELDETKHFKFIGTTGTGKSTAIAQMMERALARGDRAIIADPDGGYLRRFYDPKRGDVILNPFDQRSRKWDLFAEIHREYDVDQLARSLLPDQGGDPVWRDYARTFFTVVTRQAHASGERDVGALYQLLTSADTKDLAVLTKGTAAQPFLEKNNERMFNSLRSVAASAVKSLEFVANQDAEGFSIRDWVGQDRQKQPGVLFLPYRAGQIAALGSMISAWMRVGIYAAMDRPEGDQRLWFVVDELDALGPIDGLKDALARVRKFGGRCVLGFQSIAQVATSYGDGEAQTVVENCGNTFIFRCSASDGGGTARFASTLIGQREMLRATHSRSQHDTQFFGSSSRSSHYSIEPAVMSSEIEQIPDLCGYLKLASRTDWLRTRVLRAPEATGSRVEPPAFVPAPLPTIAASRSPRTRSRTTRSGPPPPKRASRAKPAAESSTSPKPSRDGQSQGMEP
jgi:type IV secretory pathway TraG/TraD family ATPase VirD4